MITVVLTIHVLIVLALIGVVLLQRSEGGALGMGGGGSGGGFMTGRGAANALTRTTSILAALFFATSLGLAIVADRGESDEAVLEELTGSNNPAPVQDTAAPASADDLLRTLGVDDGTEAADDTGVNLDDEIDAADGGVDSTGGAAAATEDAATEDVTNPAPADEGGAAEAEAPPAADDNAAPEEDPSN